MKTKKIALAMVCCLPFLGSCAAPTKSASNQTWRVEPLYSVNNVTQSPDSLYQLGRYYQGQQRYEQALNAYRRAIAVDGKFVEAHNGIGVVLATLGRYDEAVAALRTAIRVDTGNSAHLYNNLGHALSLQGAYIDAIYALEIAAALEPTNTQARQNLAQTYARAEAAGKLPEKLAGQQAQPISAEAGAVEPADADYPAVALAIEPALPEEVIATTLHQPEAADTPTVVTVTPAATIQRRMETVQVAANVYELRERAGPAKVATAMTIPEKPAATGPLTLRLEVANGNGITGFARRMGAMLKDYGFSTARLTNQKPFNVKSSQIQYRPGFREAAEQLQASLPGDTELVQTDKLRQDIQARLLLGRDMMQSMAQRESSSPTRLASHEEGKLVR